MVLVVGFPPVAHQLQTIPYLFLDVVRDGGADYATVIMTPSLLRHLAALLDHAVNPVDQQTFHATASDGDALQGTTAP